MANFSELKGKDVIERHLDEAKKLINDFCNTEYLEDADFSDLHKVDIAHTTYKVDIAYTTYTDKEFPIQVSADLIEHKIIYQFDDEILNVEQYDSIEDMNKNALSCLNFGNLLYVPYEVIDKRIISNFKRLTDRKFNSVAFNGQLPRNIERSVREDIQNIIDSNEIEAQIVDLAIVGSRCRGLENDDSDIDIAVEFVSDIKENALFNIIHEEIITIGSVNVDINPIRAEETGTLGEYLIIAEQSIEKNYNEKQERKITMERKNVTAEIGKKYVHKNGSEFMCIGFDKDTKHPIMQNTETLWICSVSGLGQYDNEMIDWDFSSHGRFEEQLGSADGIVAKKEYLSAAATDDNLSDDEPLDLTERNNTRR